MLKAYLPQAIPRWLVDKQLAGVLLASTGTEKWCQLCCGQQRRRHDDSGLKAWPDQGPTEQLIWEMDNINHSGYCTWCHSTTKEMSIQNWWIDRSLLSVTHGSSLGSTGQPFLHKDKHSSRTIAETSHNKLCWLWQLLNYETEGILEPCFSFLDTRKPLFCWKISSGGNSQANLIQIWCWLMSHTSGAHSGSSVSLIRQQPNGLKFLSMQFHQSGI